jgi:CDP-diacylglycerol--glycerol-3-phosphate 3-phosphatidyltransferase
VTWPNKITYSRILFIPLFVIAALEIRNHPQFKYVTVAVFAAMALTDLLDGLIARRFNLSSPEGKFIDPLADKLLMVTACVLLALPIWGMPDGEAPLAVEIAVVIIARDVLISAWVIATFIAGGAKSYEVSKLGRATTFVQDFMLSAMILGTLYGTVYTHVAVPLSYAAVAFTIASGLHYLFKYARTMSFHGSGSPPV